VEFVEELGLPELTSEQIEELCAIVEEAVREYFLSKVSSKRIETLNISVEAEGAKPVTLKVDVDIVLSPLMKNLDVQKLVKEAMEEAFKLAKKYLRELACHSQK
jgi:energy-converting hydrogenase A subunit M